MARNIAAFGLARPPGPPPPPHGGNALPPRRPGKPPTDAPPSTRPGNKARHTGRHHSVEPDVRRYTVTNLPHGVFRQGRNLKVLSDTLRFRRRGQNSGPALDGPGQRHLGRRLVDALGDPRDHRVVDNSRRHGVAPTERRLGPRSHARGRNRADPIEGNKDAIRLAPPPA